MHDFQPIGIDPADIGFITAQKKMAQAIASQLAIPEHLMQEQTPQQFSRYQTVLLLGKVKEEITTGAKLTGNIRSWTVYGRGNNITYHVEIGTETIPIPWRGLKAVEIPKGYEIGASVWVNKPRRGEVAAVIKSHAWSKDCDEPLSYGVEIDNQSAGFFAKDEIRLHPPSKQNMKKGTRKVIIDEG